MRTARTRAACVHYRSPDPGREQQENTACFQRIKRFHLPPLLLFNVKRQRQQWKQNISALQKTPQRTCGHNRLPSAAPGIQIKVGGSSALTSFVWLSSPPVSLELIQSQIVLSKQSEWNWCCGKENIPGKRGNVCTSAEGLSAPVSPDGHDGWLPPPPPSPPLVSAAGTRGRGEFTARCPRGWSCPVRGGPPGHGALQSAERAGRFPAQAWPGLQVRSGWATWCPEAPSSLFPLTLLKSASAPVSAAETPSCESH